MRRYTFAFLRDYFSARGLTLERLPQALGANADLRYELTNGVRLEYYRNLSEVRLRAAIG